MLHAPAATSSPMSLFLVTAMRLGLTSRVSLSPVRLPRDGTAMLEIKEETISWLVVRDRVDLRRETQGMTARLLSNITVRNGL
jgi:hypothetical protein